MKPVYLLIPLLIAMFALAEALLVLATRDATIHQTELLMMVMVGTVSAEVSLALLWAAMVHLSVGWRATLAASVLLLCGLALYRTATVRVAQTQVTWVLVVQAALLMLVTGVVSAAGCSFGRVDDSIAAMAGRARWQTSIGNLLLLTTTTAVSLSLVKWLIPLNDIAEVQRYGLRLAVLGIGNVALMVALSVAWLMDGRRLLRTAFLLIGTIVAARIFWPLDSRAAISMLSMMASQTIALLIGLAVFRACGWRIAWRRRMNPVLQAPAGTET